MSDSKLEVKKKRPRYLPIKPGDKFTRLTVLSLYSAEPKKWFCRCSCGTEKAILDRALKPRHTRSCGCIHRERAVQLGKGKRTHGQSSYVNGKQRLTPEYNAWRSMRRRCYKKQCKGYEHWGGRGIKVCTRWLKSFDNFFTDMGLRPSPNHTVERRRNAGNYNPKNCYWATRREQAQNKRNNVYLIIEGQRHCVSEWSRISGIKAGTIQRRVKYGWPINRLLQPPRKLTRRK